MAHNAINLRDSCGMLAKPEAMKGKVLSDKVREAVKSFCEDDEVSRLSPGAKDYVSVKGEPHQNRLNLKELYCMSASRRGQDTTSYSVS